MLNLPKKGKPPSKITKCKSKLLTAHESDDRDPMNTKYMDYINKPLMYKFILSG